MKVRVHVSRFDVEVPDELLQGLEEQAQDVVIESYIDEALESVDYDYEVLGGQRERHAPNCHCETCNAHGEDER